MRSNFISLSTYAAFETYEDRNIYGTIRYYKRGIIIIAHFVLNCIMSTRKSIPIKNKLLITVFINTSVFEHFCLSTYPLIISSIKKSNNFMHSLLDYSSHLRQPRFPTNVYRSCLSRRGH